LLKVLLLLCDENMFAFILPAEYIKIHIPCENSKKLKYKTMLLTVAKNGEAYINFFESIPNDIFPFDQYYYVKNNQGFERKVLMENKNGRNSFFLFS
jgi:hypothetical protein